MSCQQSSWHPLQEHRSGEEYITSSANKLRPLKNDFRQRTIPIIEPLAEVLKELDTKSKKPSDHVFPKFYEKQYKRWGNGLSWHRTLGTSPKACLDSVATSLREAEINERVIGSILGHTPKTSTGIYGSVSIEAMRNAFNYLQTL